MSILILNAKFQGILLNYMYLHWVHDSFSLICSSYFCQGVCLDDLKFTDSVLRESMRLSGPIVPFIKEVEAENGIQLNGVSLPKGTKIATDMHHMHRDEEIYRDANTFNPFRLNPSTGQPMPPAVETSENFLAFGHGRVCLRDPFQFFCIGLTTQSH